MEHSNYNCKTEVSTRLIVACHRDYWLVESVSVVVLAMEYLAVGGNWEW